MRFLASRLRPLLALLFGAVTLVVAVAFARTTFRGPERVTRSDATGVHAATFPYWIGEVASDPPLTFAFSTRGGLLAPAALILVPDDHLEGVAIDGVEVPLVGIEPAKLEDYDRGISLPFAPYVGPGEHRIVVRVRDRAGPGGLDVRVDPRHGAPLAELLVGGAGLLLLVAGAMRAARARWATVVLAAVAVAVRLVYFVATPPFVRTHDAPEHFDYVNYLLDHHALPHARDGYEFYHPPVYYLVSALLVAALRGLRFGSSVILGALQLESVAFELGFAAFAVATAKLWIDRIPDSQLGRRLWSRDGLAALCTALLLLWPSSVVHSVRVGNDDLEYLCFGGALYFASRWWIAGSEGKRAHFLAAAGFAAIGMVTKSNSLLLFGVLGVLVLARLVRDRERRVGVILAWLAPLLVLCAVTTGLALHESLAAALAGKPGDILVANAGNSAAGDLGVGNRADNYLWFDLRTYVTQAFTSPRDDGKGRQLFWNYLLKTSLFGEFSFPQSAAWNLAVCISVTCLPLLATVVVGALLLRRKQVYEELPMLAAAVVLVGASALLRMKIPTSCSNDFRYVLPVVIPLAYGYVRGLTGLRARGWTRTATASIGVGWVFAALSAAFVVVPAFAAFP